MKENGLSLYLSAIFFFFWVLCRIIYAYYIRNYVLCSYSIMALRKAEKEEERRAREKIRQKLEEDKVMMISTILLYFNIHLLAEALQY